MSDLLPCNATTAERALSETVARLIDVPARARDMWNAQTCPAALLPWLAWAFSVDEWDPGWSEEQKRAAIAASVDVHRHKGTVGALRTAIEALSIESVELIEWFEENADPYTFRLLIEVAQKDLRRSLLLRLLDVVVSTKNLRSHLTEVGIRTRSSGAIYLSAATLSGHNFAIEFSGDPV